MDLLNEVYKTVKTIDNKVSKILQWKAAHTERHESIERDIKKVHGSLFSSEDGLVGRMRRLQGCKTGIEDKAKARRQFIFGVLSRVLAAGIIAAITWFIIRTKGD